MRDELPVEGADERSRRLESDAAAVQIMTVHVSKGLEFPVVYVPFAWDRWVPDTPAVLRLHDDGGRRVLDVGGPGEGALAALRTRVEKNPQDGEALAGLGAAYLQRVRETSDFSYLPRAETLLHRALAVDSQDPIALLSLSSLAGTRHRFGEALALGRRARAAAPGSARTEGAIADALSELGRYDASFAAVQRMVDLRDWLHTHADDARAYAEAKQHAAQRVSEAVAADSGVDGRRLYNQLKEPVLHWLQRILGDMCDAQVSSTKLAATGSSSRTSA